MFIDPFQDNWLEILAERITLLKDDVHVYLLLDGAFAPGMYRESAFADCCTTPVHLLFGGLPGATDDVKDASPFVAMIARGGEALRAGLASRLETCNGLPMVSAIATTEELDALGKRLAAWCIVENDGQRFNFRFPDTRRLPGIYSALKPEQQAEFCGPMLFWSYIGRNGAWSDLDIKAQNSKIVSDAELDDTQFADIVNDCAADEIVFRLTYSGFSTSLPHSMTHAIVNSALVIAREAELDQPMTEGWCQHVLAHQGQDNSHEALNKWLTLFSDVDSSAQENGM